MAFDVDYKTPVLLKFEANHTKKSSVFTRMPPERVRLSASDAQKAVASAIMSICTPSARITPATAAMFRTCLEGTSIPDEMESWLPIYEYRCLKCGHQFEKMQNITDDAVRRCEKCGDQVTRLFHPVAVHFKGSGFYSTDYGKRSSGQDEREKPGEKKAGAKEKQDGKKDQKKPPQSKHP